MSRGPDVATSLERALLARAEAAGCAVTIPKFEVQRWASATFVGAQHSITLAAQASPALDSWLAALPETEFALRGHLVADLTVTVIARDGDAVSIALEVLTVEER